MNLPDCPDSMQTVFYMIDPKTLQLKWTDIEIRKHVIPQMQQEQNNNEEVEDDLPPLEQPATEIDSDRKAPSPERVEPEESNTNHTEEAEEENEEELKTQIKSTIEKITDMHQTKEAKKTKSTPVFSYSDDDEESTTPSSSSRATGASAKPNTVQYSKYTDLEELDWVIWTSI